MKKFFFILILGLCVPFEEGCEYTGNGPQIKGDTAAHVRSFMTTVEPGIRPSVRLSATLYLDYATNPADRADLKANIFTASSIAAAIDDSVTPGELSKRIQAALPAGDENKQLADAIAGSWGIVLPFAKGDPAILITWISDIAGGLADVTKT